MTANGYRPAFAGAVALGLLSLLSLVSFFPIPFKPHCLVLVLPAMALYRVARWGSDWSLALVPARIAPLLITPTLFAVWYYAVIRGTTRVPRASRIAFALLSAVSVAWTVYGWPRTTQVYGSTTATALAIQALVPPLAILAFAYLKPPENPRDNVLLHWVVFGWLTWSAIPWYGELI